MEYAGGFYDPRHWIQLDPYSSSEFETISSVLHPNMLDLPAIRKIFKFVTGSTMQMLTVRCFIGREG